MDVERGGGTSFLLGVLGGGDRSGRWRVAERLTVLNVLRGADLDLREAKLAPEGADGGPYDLKISLIENRLALDIQGPGYQRRHILSLSPFRAVIRDYFMICESYYKAIRTSSPSQIEAIDMGRRGLHNEGSELLSERLKEKIEIDFDTARRLFTLICVLHWKG